MKIARDIVDDIEKWLGKEKIIILQGARQVGKTTILRHLRDKLERRGCISKYFSMDFELNNPLFKEPRLFIKFINEQYDGKFVYIFLDEFQYIKEAGLYLKILFDQLKGKCQFIVSGSSSLKITQNSEFLTGRKVSFHVRTLSFKEFSRYKSDLKLSQSFTFDDINLIEDFDKIYGSELKTILNEYVSFGGYPEIVLTTSPEDKRFLLKELISTYIQKDVAGFLRIANTAGFNNLLRLLISQSGNLVNKNELSSSLNLCNDTVNKYCEILEGTYVINFVRPFYSNIRKELSKMPKVYCSDFGISSVLLNTRGASSYEETNGALIENFVFNELRNKFDHDEIYFYRTISKSEIDFIVRAEDALIPVEVKFTNKKPSRPVALKHFAEVYENAGTGVVVTKNHIIKSDFYGIPAYLVPFVDFAKLNQ